MLDKHGQEAKVGDICLEVTGWGSYPGDNGKRIESSLARLFEIPEVSDGSGIIYDYDGTKSSYWWANVDQSTVLNKERLSKELLYAFYHGLHNLEIPKDVQGSVYDALDASDWKKQGITEEYIARLLALDSLVINSLEDVANNFALLQNGPLSSRLATKIRHLAGIKDVPVYNGELGLAWAEDKARFLNLMELFKKWQSFGVLLENCIEVDKELRAKI